MANRTRRANGKAATEEVAIDLVRGTEHEFQRDLTWFRQTFTLWPERLMGLALPIPLEWRYVKFEPGTAAQVSQQRGVYAFVIQHFHAALPPHGYVAYIGITGNASDRRNLRIRFNEYLKEQRGPGRPTITTMLQKWRDCIYFHFAEIPDEAVHLPTIERALNDAVIPPFSQQDFSAEVRKAKRVVDIF